MILTCPECTTRYRFDDHRIPAAGLAVRCKKCRTVFRAHKQAAAPAMAMASAAVSSEGSPRGASGSSTLGDAPGRGAGVPQNAEPARPSVTKASSRPSLKTEQSAPRPPLGGQRGVEKAPAALSTAPAARPEMATGTTIPVTVVPGGSGPGDEEIRRLTRIILSDIVIYGPERADAAIRDGRFPEVYRSEIEEGRKMIRSRFSAAPAAVETYERALREQLEARRKELQESAEAL